jgi:[protein-PII] uridylyltransferase
VEKALRGDLRLTDAIAQRKPSQEAPHGTFTVAPSVRFDNGLSRRHSVVEVIGLDRTGLLHDLTRAIGDLNLNIASAHIATFGERAVDVFYVTDLVGAKIDSPQRQTAIRRKLLDVLGAAPRATPGRAEAGRAAPRDKRATG